MLQIREKGYDVTENRFSRFCHEFIRLRKYIFLKKYFSL